MSDTQANPKILNVAILNQAQMDFGYDFMKMVAALQKQVERDFAPTWGVGVNLIPVDSISDDDYLALILVKNATVAGALGYHDTTPKGNPIGYVFVETTLRDGGKIPVTVSHELLEMLGNPDISGMIRNPQNNYVYAREACDAVQNEEYGIDGIPVSNFVLPAWFNNTVSGGKVDFLGNCSGSFQIDRGGYMPVQVGGQWTQIFGSKEAELAYKADAHYRSPRILNGELPVLASRSLTEIPIMDPQLFQSQSSQFQQRAVNLKLDWNAIKDRVLQDGPIVLDVAEILIQRGLTVDAALQVVTKLGSEWNTIFGYVLKEQQDPNSPSRLLAQQTAAFGGGGILLPLVIKQVLAPLIRTHLPTVLLPAWDDLINNHLNELLQALVSLLPNSNTATNTSPSNPPSTSGTPVINIP
jgi:hypothetical protein